MVVDEKLLSDPEFKKKLFAVDEILMNTPVEKDKPLPSSPIYNILLRRTGNNSVDCDEVYPGVFVGDANAARNKQYLKSIGVTHVLNTAMGQRFNMVSTNAEFYRDVGIAFKGLALDDTWMEDISRTFEESAKFIDEALSSGGKVLVHCLAGVSRSATTAIAYLMLRQGKSVENAVRTVRANRRIFPNEGFLRQLVQLDMQLRADGTSEEQK